MRSLLGARLEDLYQQRCNEPLPRDPVIFCHQCEGVANQEVVACLAAGLAYGGVAQIERSIRAVVETMGDNPAHFVDKTSFGHARKLFASFKHRFTTGDDIALFCCVLGEMRRQAGSIGAFVARYANPAHHTSFETIDGFSRAVRGMDVAQCSDGIITQAPRSFYFLFPSPQDGSACKRVCMLLRWMVRPADGVDLGLWHMLRPDQLVVPVDRHIGRIACLLGFTDTDVATWRNAERITAALRRYDAYDPVKYDFSLCHLGITEGCRGIREACCQACPVRPWCLPEIKGNKR